MNKEEFIEYVIANNYEYYENKDEVHINEIYDDLGNTNEMITYFKNIGEIQLDYLKENGSFKTHIVNGFEQEVIKYFNLLESEVENENSKRTF